MKYELTREQLIELAECIATCNLTPDEACEYIVSTAYDMQKKEDARIVWPTEERIERIGQNGGDGIHHEQIDYNKVIETGVYES